MNSSATRPTPSGRNQSRDRLIGWAFVAAQAGLIVSLVVLPGADHYSVPTWLATAADVSFWVGATLTIVSALALGRSLTATPVPTERATLRTNGPYRWVRHPIYTGVVAMVAAMALRSGSLLGLFIGAVTIVFFHVKASWEERRLTERFHDYAAYATRTPRFIPSPRKFMRGER